MRFLTAFFIVISSVLSFSQTANRSIQFNSFQSQSAASNARINSVQTIDTLKLPFIDDFSTSSITPDTAKWINTGGVYINNHYPVKAPSINVATFDGLNENGFPYKFTNNPNSSLTVRGDIDYLQSKPIDLSTYTDEDSLAISFFWQMGGNHDLLFPNLEKEDTLRLLFLDKDTNWVQVWPKTSADSTKMADFELGGDFEFEFLPIQDSIYLHAGFQFKFQAYGLKTGNWNMWQIDYIYLDTNRTNENIQDFAFSGQVTSLLNGYSAIPYNQFIHSPSTYLNTDVKAIYNNLSDANNFRDTIITTITDSNFTGTSTVVNTGNQYPIQIIANSDTTIPYSIDEQSIVDYITNSNQKDFALTNKHQLTGQDQIELLSTNDIVENTSYISNYIAYDDGTDESTVGFSFLGFTLVAYQYELIVSDTLTSIFFKWAKTGYDLEGTALNIVVWNSLEGVDGATETKKATTTLSTISYSNDLDGFTRVDLNSAVVLPAGKFYVGWEFFVTDKELMIATDMSVNNMDKFYQFKQGQWSNASTDLAYGSPLIRPKFGIGNSLGLGAVGLDERDLRTSSSLTSLEIYPNPANNMVTIEGVYNQITIYSLTGEIVWERSFSEDKTKFEVNTSDLNEGMYIVEASNNERSSSKRLTITHY